MITGFNTDVEHDGRVYHVQTEDKGLVNPVVESLIYTGGEIVESRRTSYADLAEKGEFDDDEILMRMEAQHQAMIRDIRNGKFDVGGPKPFGHNIITNRSLDEVVMTHLLEEDSLSALVVELVDEQVLKQGGAPTLVLKVSEPGTARAVARARVTVRLISTHDQPRELASVDTNEQGFAEASIRIPEDAGADMAVVCQVRAAGHKAEVRQLVHRAARSATKVG